MDIVGLAAGKADRALAAGGGNRRPGRLARHAALPARIVRRRLQGLRRRLPDQGDHDTRSTGAGGRLDVDYGRCVVCQLCIEACPTGAMAPSSDWAFGVRDARRSRLEENAGSRACTGAQTRRAFRRSLHVRHVDAGSCNGCESELQALNNPFYNLHRLGIFFTASPRFADLLLVTGPVTHAMLGPAARHLRSDGGAALGDGGRHLRRLRRHRRRRLCLRPRPRRRPPGRCLSARLSAQSRRHHRRPC